jgi:hypothetical protein
VGPTFRAHEPTVASLFRGGLDGNLTLMGQTIPASRPSLHVLQRYGAWEGLRLFTDVFDEANMLLPTER